MTAKFAPHTVLGAKAVILQQQFFFGKFRYDDPWQRWSLNGGGSAQEESNVFYAFYVVATIILVLHFTGWLKRNNLEWIMLVLAVAVFPAVIFLK